MALKIVEGRLPLGANDLAAANQGIVSTETWWRQTGAARAASIQKEVLAIQTESMARRQLEILHMSMYAAGNVAGEGLKAVTRFQSRSPIRLRSNLCESICDALQARIAKIRPRPRYITSAGDWSLRKKAEAIEAAMDGELERNKVDALAPRVFLDAAIAGTGNFHVMRTGEGYPHVERCAPGEVMVQYFDGLAGAPRNMYRGRLVNLDYILERFGGSPNSAKYQQILAAPKAPPQAYTWLRSSQARCDQIYVIDAWHKGAKPCHVIIAGHCELWRDDQWDGKRFPIVTLRWKDRQFGWYGKGAVEEITPEQVETNYTLEKIQFILHNVSTVRYWAQAGNKIELNAQRASNFPGEMLRFYGSAPPIKEATDSVPRELWEAVDRAQARAFQKTGISEFFAQSEKPAGLNSGEAQRVYEDVGDARMLIKGRAYEAMHLELVRVMTDVKREIANDPNEKESPVTVQRKRARGVTVQTLKWRDLDLSDDSYMLQLLEQSSLPGTPAGRTATVGEWIQMGLITPDEGKELLNMPDIKAELSLSLATKDGVLSAIESIVDDGEWWAPHPCLDLQLALQLACASFTRLEWEGVPEARLEMVARYIEELRMLAQQAAPPQQAAPMGASPLAGGPGLAATPGQLGGVPAPPIA